MSSAQDSEQLAALQVTVSAAAPALVASAVERPWLVGEAA